MECRAGLVKFCGLKPQKKKSLCVVLFARLVIDARRTQTLPWHKLLFAVKLHSITK